MDFHGLLEAPPHLQAFVTSLAIGLLIGLERERRRSAKAGLRTFALVALLGTVSGMLAEKAGSGWILAAGLLAVGAMIIAAYLKQPDDAGDPGTTSVVALLVCYCLGAAVWYGYGTLAVMVAIATTVLLYFKAELHGISHRLTPKDIISILQFAVLSFVILPILPDRSFGPYEAFNPHQAWLMVVLVSGVSLAGYAALRLAGPQHGAPMMGLLGGLVSSTATTVVFSRHARNHAALAHSAMVVIMIASLMVLLRLSIMAAVVAPAIIEPLLKVFSGGLILGLAVTAFGWRRLETQGELPSPEVRNPTEIRTALAFGALYAVVLLCAAWLSDVAGPRGMYAVALASGLTDVDAITLSSLRLFALDKLTAGQAVTSIALAVLSNLTFKAGLVVTLGGWVLARRTLPAMAAVAAGIGLGLILV
ncbi:MAG: MgtC/SapB family protein [Betaproteobacteria bacterium]|nr:MgtC/SapB family protein [Betaproteobacteria bacterium]